MKTIQVCKIVLFVLMGLLIFVCWGNSGADETPAEDKTSEMTTIELPEGGRLSKTSIHSAALFHESKSALADLSEEGKRILQEFSTQLLAAKTDFAKRYPGLSVNITISTTCYDEQPLSMSRAETMNEYLRQLLSEHDRTDFMLKIKYMIGQKVTKETQSASEADAEAHQELSSQIYAISAELKIKERGPQVSHPTDILLYEILEE